MSRLWVAGFSLAFGAVVIAWLVVLTVMIRTVGWLA